mgnify:FL=1
MSVCVRRNRNSPRPRFIARPIKFDIEPVHICGVMPRSVGHPNGRVSVGRQRYIIERCGEVLEELLRKDPRHVGLVEAAPNEETRRGILGAFDGTLPNFELKEA